MHKAHQLPYLLRRQPFTTDLALRMGVKARRLRALELTHPFHGVHTTASVDDHRARCVAYATRMGGGVAFSHYTAARLYGCPLPPVGPNDALDVSVEYPRTPPRGRGVAGHSLKVLDLANCEGLRVCTPAQTWCQLGGLIPREDLVAVGDYLVGARKRRVLANHDELTAAAIAHGRTRGAADRRWALERIRWGTDSRPESLLRLAMVDAGYPEPVVNAPIRVAAGLELHPDLAMPQFGVLLEYEGDGHRTDDTQWHDDIVRRDLFEAADWRVVRVTRHDLFADRAAFFARFAAVAERFVSKGRFTGD